MAQITISERALELVARHGGMNIAARALRIDKAYLSRMVSGDKNNPGAAILKKLGLRRITVYERTKP